MNVCVCGDRGGKGKGGVVGKEKYFSSILLYPFFTPSPPKGHKKKKIKIKKKTKKRTKRSCFSRFNAIASLLPEI